MEVDLDRFGERVATDVMDMADDANTNSPKLRQYDNWGRRIDTIDTSAGWRALHDVAAEEGLVAIAYERKHGAKSRLHWCAKAFLFAGSSGSPACSSRRATVVCALQRCTTAHWR